MSDGTTPSAHPQPAVPEPQRTPLPTADPLKVKLYENVRHALLALPAYFTSATIIEGVDATDLFSLNTLLGGAIEGQVVETLNRVRSVWDPDDEWVTYRFVRRSQSFPDVRLVNTTDEDAHPAMGIELKGWYLLAKENMPSFRYAVTPGACSPFDLLVVVPWHLKNVLAGAPVVIGPYVEQARYAAEMRNYYWQHLRDTSASTAITSPLVSPYSAAGTAINDTPEYDGGSNFGRLARVRTGLLTDFISRSLGTKVVGIEAAHWVRFFTAFTEARSPEALQARVANIVSSLGVPTGNRADRAADLLWELAGIVLTQEAED